MQTRLKALKPSTNAMSNGLFALGVATLGATAAVTVLFAVNRMTDSDPMGSLLVAESLVSRGSVFLDHYPELVRTSLGYRLTNVGGNLAYAFPPGTSLIVLPIALLMHVFGQSMVEFDHVIQIGIAALTAFLTVALSALLARRLVNSASALLIAGSVWFGTSFSSTGATALWSHNFTVVFALASLWVLTIMLQSQSLALWPWLSGCLFMAFLVRPQSLTLAVVLVATLTVTWRQVALRLVLSLGVLFGIFLTLNMVLTGQLLPEYFRASRLLGEADFFTALYGNVISPGRGFLIYTPILLALPVLAMVRDRRWSRTDLTLLAVALAWITLHLIAISRFDHWWGGWAFGARLMTDVVPAVVLLTALVWPHPLRSLAQKLSVGLFVCLAVISVWMHSYQGLLNPYTRFWYVEPNLDLEPELISNWAYPQFLHSEKRHEQRLRERTSTPPPIPIGVPLPVTSPEIALVGWSSGFISNGISLPAFRDGPLPLLAEGGRRWSEGNSARILLNIREQDLPLVQGSFRLFVDSITTQPIGVAINNQEAYEGIITDGRVVIDVTFDPAILRAGENEVVITMPAAVDVGEASDFRRLAIALWQVLLS